MKKNYICRCVIIKADEPDPNFNVFSKEELLKSYKSFVGKPVKFGDVKVGEIIDATFNEDRVECTVKLNKG